MYVDKVTALLRTCNANRNVTQLFRNLLRANSTQISVGTVKRK